MDEQEEERLRNMHEIEQAMKGLTDSMPSAWKSLYDACVKEGFTEKQSMEILLSFINLSGTGNK